jgi:DNA-binding NarL/FixJ family response regulator
MIRLLLVDDQDLFRQGLATLLSVEPDFQVVGQARHGHEAIALTEELSPDVILMDIQMPECDGIVATQTIHSRYPWIRILVLTTFDTDEYIVQALQAGALGYLLKHTSAEQFAAAIRSVYLGYGQLSPTVVSKVFRQLKPFQPSPSKDCANLLTRREIEVLQLIGEGKTNQEISTILHLQEGTVKNYVTRILSQLELRDRVQAALWARQHLLDRS